MKNDSKLFPILALILILGAAVAVYVVYFRKPASPELKPGNSDSDQSAATDNRPRANPRDFTPEAAGRADPVVTKQPEPPISLDKAVRRMQISGRVLDERGGALHDIRVEFQGTGDLALFRGTGYTDPSGNYSLLAWERSNIRKAQTNDTGGFVHARAADGRLAAGEAQLFALSASATMADIVLRVQSGIEGDVRDNDGAPAPFAQVTLRSLGMIRDIDESGGSITYDHRPIARSAMADDRGRYGFAGLPPGKYTLSVEGGFFGTAQASGEVDVTDGKVQWHELKLARQNFVRGTLRDQDGVAVEGAVVVLHQIGALKTPDGDVINTNGDDLRAKIDRKREGERGRDFRANKTRWRSVTDPEGRFGFANIHDVELELQAQLGKKTVEIKNVRVNQGDYSLSLPLDSSITGTVRDAASNQPVTRYDIRVISGDGEPTPFDRVSSDAVFPWHSEGRFRMLNAAEGSVALRVSAPGYAPAVIRVKDLAANERRTGADVALKPLCDLVLTLKQGEKLLPREPVLLLYDGRSVAEGSTDDFGEVRLPGVVPAEYEIKVQRADGSVLAVRHSVPAQNEQRATLALMPK
ncbi:MAG: carboxypeptidase regulatory-like domain-containing protein [Planctomycetes bacterium]|nr:carboxypeptidase regulatory-like domain-containing protein [Planctomycetota bacterium]CAG0974483.1 hypothetical protein PLCT2_01540 [Planctomycetaceae bacterium]